MMEKETSTRRSLLRALYLLPLVCISLALNAQTKVNYVYDNGKNSSGQLSYDNNKTKAQVNIVYDEIKMDGEALENMTIDDISRMLPDVKKDADGNLTSQGNQIKRVVINGKVLYDKDASANATPATPKISVFDSGEDMNMEFTGYTEQTVEDLIKRLPGSEIDEDGNITVNGKPVSKILVNGKQYLPVQGIPVEENAEEIVRLAEDGKYEEAFDLLPGATRDKDGNLFINGKAVTKVLVNGEELNR